MLLPHTVAEVEVRVSWGDYVTEPPLPEDTLEESGSKAPPVEWRRLPREALMQIKVPVGRGLTPSWSWRVQRRKSGCGGRTAD